MIKSNKKMLRKILSNKSCISRHLSDFPECVDTKIKIYNYVTKSQIPLKMKTDNILTWYTCGPTVYDSAHLGHASCYVKIDIIQRILKHYFRKHLVTAMNITDIDDKIIKRSRDKKMPISELTEHYEKEFWHDMKSLNVPKPDIVLKVTENLHIIKTFIKNLEENNFAYNTSTGSVYFDVTNYGSYGKFVNVDKMDHDLESGSNKKSKLDFALWKASKEGEPAWDSPWGKGRPGWHIECSSLASLIFGSGIDIHAGGIDLRFPHHENEEAQSCAFHSTNQWVTHWLHTGHLHLKDSEKMSKSLKNTISIQDLLKSTTADVFRMACFMSHYRSNMEFSQDYMSTAATLLNGYKNFLSSCKDYQNQRLSATVDKDAVYNLVNNTREKVHDALCDDFNTPIVVKYLSDLIHNINIMLYSSASSATVELAPIAAASNFVLNILNTVGVGLQETSFSDKSDDTKFEILDILSNFRQDVRLLGIASKDKNLLKLCDDVRDRLRKCGVTIKDQGQKSSWSL